MGKQLKRLISEIFAWTLVILAGKALGLWEFVSTFKVIALISVVEILLFLQG